MAIQDDLDTALKLINDKRLEEAKPLVERILLENPLSCDAKRIGGLWMQQSGLLKEALLFFNQAFKLDPEDSRSLIGMGQVLLLQKENEKAHVCFTQALKKSADNPYIYAGLGQSLLKKDVRQARSYLEKALELNPTMVNIKKTLCFLYYHEGEFECMETFALKDVALGNKAVLREILAEYYLHAYRWNDLSELAKKTASMLEMPPIESAKIMVFDLIGRYITGRTEHLPEYFELASHLEKVGDVSDPDLKVVKNFYFYIKRLLQYCKENSIHYQGHAEHILHVVGDSHSLGVAHLCFRRQNVLTRCESHLTMGTKAFHIKENARNRYVLNLKTALSNLPVNSDVLMVLGEIDCRIDQGIVLFTLKSNGSLKDIAEKTACDYVQYASALVQEYGHRVMFATVPPIAAELVKRISQNNDRRGNALLKMAKEAIDYFNDALRASCIARGVDVMDVYAEALGKDGYADSDAHIDSFHLKPHIIRQALERGKPN